MAKNRNKWNEEQLLASVWTTWLDAFDKKDFAAGKTSPDLYDQEIRAAYAAVIDMENMLAAYN